MNYQNKDWLSEKYLNEKLTMKQISKECNCCEATIRNWINRFKIPPRPAAALKGERNFKWNGGRYTAKSGYVFLLIDGERKLEHRHLLEESLGRKLLSEEHIHHINGNPSDNRLENLQIMTSSDHIKLEQKLSSFAKEILYGDKAVHLKDELKTLWENYVKE
jgi:hypothetical protein